MPAPAPTLPPQEPYPQPDDSDSTTWNPYVVVPLIIICIAILFISYYRIVKQLLCGLGTVSFSRTRVRMRHLNMNDLRDPDPSSLELQSRGLESNIMHALPISQFANKLKGEEHPGECAVCLGDFEEGEWLKHLPLCGHVFHVACIDTWFQMHSSCPICRSCVCDLGDDECSGSVNSFIETLRREDFSRQTELP